MRLIHFLLHVINIALKNNQCKTDNIRWLVEFRVVQGVRMKEIWSEERFWMLLLQQHVLYMSRELQCFMCVCVCVSVCVCVCVCVFVFVFVFPHIRKRRENTGLWERDMVSILEEISWIYVDVVIWTMQRILRNGADNYSVDSVTLSMKHLSPIWVMCACVRGHVCSCVCICVTNPKLL